MESIIRLSGQDYQVDKELIKRNMDALKDPIFITDKIDKPLYTQIDSLYEAGLENQYLCKIKICQEILFENNVSLKNQKQEETVWVSSMTELLQKLDDEERYSIIIENDDRTLLANLVQQLIYIDYPLHEINIRLRKEFKDAEKTYLFMKRIDELQEASQKAERLISKIQPEFYMGEEDQKSKEILSNACLSFQKISEQIEKAKAVEMKIAIAASKKTGKSVIVNSMLGMELAPTSLELATPNSCIYQKSKDDKFHIRYNNKVENFSSREEIYHFVQKEFKQAEQNAQNNFVIPDMEIDYVSDSNNFESYTIYDTPGPDAAGTGHKESAEKAIQNCDVAVFAIDYSKYLTTPEVDYLEKIREIFEKNHKFHTLIFTINKIDLALNDKGQKSRVRSIDFIRCRLINIDKKYSDCIVFATSAQDYFYTKELELEMKKDERIKSILDWESDWYYSLRPAILELDKQGIKNDDLRTVLSNLDSQVSLMSCSLKYPRVGYKEIRQFSGIPQMMGYLSYVMQSKAREEIVNSITYKIDSQCQDLKELIAQIHNIEELMGRTEQDIKKIEGILGAYLKNVNEILKKTLSKTDLACIPQNSMLAAQVDEYCKKNIVSFPIEIEAVLKSTRENMMNGLDADSVKKALWDAYERKQIKKIQVAASKGKKKLVEEDDIKWKEEDSHDIIEEYASLLKKHKIDNEKIILDELQNALSIIVQKRYQEVVKETQSCQNLLEKQNCYLLLPEPSHFDPVISEVAEVPISDINKIETDFTTMFMKINPIHQFLRNLYKGKSLGNTTFVIKNASDEKLKQEIVKQHKPFCDWIDSNNICKIYQEMIDSIGRSASVVEQNIIKSFVELNKNCEDRVKAFKEKIDDRTKYEQNLDILEHQKKVISQIKNGSSDFTRIWNEIV